MAISNDLIAKFAKMSKESKIQRETTVFGTTVEYGGKLYVKMDGSDLLTPVATTSEIAAGERVTVMVKDHTATVMGNISNPSASKKTTDAIEDEITTITATIGNFELVVADKVTTKELEAEVARIEELIADSIVVTDLTAVNAAIKNLEAEVADIDLALIDKAEIVDLNAANAEIGTLKANVANIQTLIGGNLTMDNIQSLILTSSKVTVDNAFIKDAMIDRVSASKLTAGTINTNLINIGSEDGSMSINGSLQQFKDSEGNVRIQIGKDASGDFTFVLYGADGQGQLINQNGITSSAIGDGLIVNDMVADNAAISGEKLDIESVITEINGSTTTIKSSQIYFDDKAQSLEVAFDQLSTKVDLIEGVDGDLGVALEQIAANTTSINVVQGEIETLISNTTITKENGEVVQMKDDYSQFKQEVDEFEMKLSSLETNYSKTLKSTKTQYYVSTSSTELVGGSWSDNSPVWVTGKYIWQRLLYTYSDDSTANSTPVCIQGAQGEDGAPGEKGEDGAPGEKGEDGAPGEKGEDGAPGEDGQSVISITPQFQAHTSSAEAPTGEWSDFCPPYEKGKYLWVRTKVIFDNPAEIKYTEPYYDPSWDAKSTADDAHNTVVSKVAEFTQTLDGFEMRVNSTEIKMDTLSVGAENFLNGTSDTPIPAEWTAETDIQIGQTIAIADYGLEFGDAVSFRVYINSSNVDLTPALIFTDEAGVTETVYGVKVVMGDMPSYATVTAAIPDGKPNIGCYLTKDDNTTAALIQYSKAKLERGSLPTDWSLSIDDTRGLVEDATQMTLSDGTVVYVKDKVVEHNVTLEGITQSVSSLETHFGTDGTVTNLTQQVSTLEQFASQFTMEFFEKLENADQGVTQLLSYIHFDINGITIGQDDYPIRLMLTKDRIKFLDSADVELAYFSEGKLYVNSAEILDTFKIGNYGFMPAANGGITIGTLS